VNGFEDTQGGFLRDRADLGLNVRLKADRLHLRSVAGAPADLLQREPKIVDNLLEGDSAIRVLSEVLARGSNCAAVFVRQFVLIVADYDFKELDNSRKLPGLELTEQFMGFSF